MIRPDGGDAVVTDRAPVVADVTMTVVRLPFRDPIEPHMHRQLPHWRYFEVCEVELADGTVGFGETMLYYTWEHVTNADVDRAVGSNPADLFRDDSLGAGLQIALLDAVGKVLEVPAHRLLGEKVRDEVPMAWWAIDMPPADLAAEAERAERQGYTRLKYKGRPWFDIRAQLEAIEERLPNWFRVSIDFNKTFPDAEAAIPILQDLQSYPNVEAFEEPVYQSQYKDNRRIREAIDTTLAHHYGYEPPWEALAEGVADGYVLNGGASKVYDEAAVCAEAGLPQWPQLVGTELTAAFCVELGAVLRADAWPAVTCHQLYDASPLATPLTVEEGTADVSDAPGLGVELDRDAVNRYAVKAPDEQPTPPRLVEVDWPDGRTQYFASGHQLRSYTQEWSVPLYERGVEARLVPDDRSERWQSLYERALEAGPVEEA